MQPAKQQVENKVRIQVAELSAVRQSRELGLHQPSKKFCAVVLAMLVLVGALLRVDFMRAVGFCIDGDEAIVGLMGKHILEGRGVPVFYYGQHYMGSLEALFASVSFAMFGVSPLSLQLVPLVFSLVLIVLTFALGRSVMSQRAGLVAAALMAVAPPALLVWSSKARGGFIEVVVLGALALLVCIAWIRTHPERLRFPILLGFLLGVGWWVNNQIVYFIVPIGLFSLLHSFSQSMRLAGNGIAGGTTVGVWRGVVRIALCGLGAFLVGSGAYWLYNVQRNFPSAGMYQIVDLREFIAHVRGLLRVALPMIVGAQRFWQKASVFPGAKILAVFLYLLPLAALLVLRRRELFGVLRGVIDRQRPIEIVTLFCLTCCGIFALSSFGGLVQAPRYLLPIYLGIFVLLGVCCELLLQRSFALGASYCAALLVFQVAASYVGGRGIVGEPVVFAGERVARNHKPLIEALRSLGISRVRTNYWIGYRLAFETDEAVTFTQLGEPFQIRIPEYEQIAQAERELLPLVLVKGQVPMISAALQKMGVTFSRTQAGEYVILHSLTRSLPESVPFIVKPGEATLQALGPIDPWLAFDGRGDTRWGTAAPQTPGQTFRIELLRPIMLEGVGYIFGSWWADRPRELKIEVEDTAGVRSVLLSPFEAKGAFDISIGAGGFVVRTKPLLVKRILLTQQASDSVFDWSIPELSLFGVYAGNS